MRRPRPENRLGRVPAARLCRLVVLTAWLITAPRSAKDPVAALEPPTCWSDTAGACSGMTPAGACTRIVRGKMNGLQRMDGSAFSGGYLLALGSISSLGKRLADTGCVHVAHLNVALF